ncbi:hypothetical protein NF868_15640 [Bacillus zhangzhouensis]|nr:hypothetical protein NF868_15640 [Bacillus zhangzhouensis]
MSTTVIISGARTPFGKLGGALSGLTAAELGGIAILMRHAVFKYEALSMLIHIS